MDYNGISINDYGVFEWKEIEKLYIKNAIPKVDISARLIVITRNRKYFMRLENNRKSRADINFWIEFFKTKSYVRQSSLEEQTINTESYKSNCLSDDRNNKNNQ